MGQIADLISSDASLSAKVLKIINSPFYGLINKVTTINQAICLLRLNTVKNLSLSLILKTTFLTKENNSINLSGFWKESLVGAISCKILADRSKINNAEDVFFLGVLENIGSLTMAYMLPDQNSMVQPIIQTYKISAHEAENQIFGFNHMDIGALLTKSWGLPDTFYIPIQHHHRIGHLPEVYSTDVCSRTSILHLSFLYIDLIKDGQVIEVLRSHFKTPFSLVCDF